MIDADSTYANMTMDKLESVDSISNNFSVAAKRCTFEELRIIKHSFVSIFVMWIFVCCFYLHFHTNKMKVIQSKLIRFVWHSERHQMVLGGIVVSIILAAWSGCHEVVSKANNKIFFRMKNPKQANMDFVFTEFVYSQQKENVHAKWTHRSRVYVGEWFRCQISRRYRSIYGATGRKPISWQKWIEIFTAFDREVCAMDKAHLYCYQRTDSALAKFESSANNGDFAHRYLSATVDCKSSANIF